MPFHIIIRYPIRHFLIFVSNRRLKGLPRPDDGYRESLFAARKGRRDGKTRKESLGGCNRSAATTLRRVIDNDNFVSAVPRTVLTSGLCLLHRAGGSYKRKRRQVGCVERKRRRETAGRVVGTMRRHRERGARRVPPADSSFLPN